MRECVAKLPPTHDRVVKPDPAAVATATGFLAKIDAGSYAPAYEQLAARVDAAVRVANSAF